MSKQKYRTFGVDKKKKEIFIKLHGNRCNASKLYTEELHGCHLKILFAILVRIDNDIYDNDVCPLRLQHSFVIAYLCKTRAQVSLIPKLFVACSAKKSLGMWLGTSRTWAIFMYHWL